VLYLLEVDDNDDVVVDDEEEITLDDNVGDLQVFKEDVDAEHNFDLEQKAL